MPTLASRGGSKRKGVHAVKSVAVVGASGAVGDVMIRLLAERKFPVGSIKFLASERSAGKIGDVRRARRSRSSRSRPGRSRGSTSSCRARRRRSPAQFSPIAARAGAVVVDNSSLPDGPRGAAGRPRGQPAGRGPAPGDHRQPQLLDDPDGRGAQAPARRLPDPPGGRQHLSVGLGGGPEGDRTSSGRQTAAHVARAEPPRARPSSPTRSPSTACPRSTTSSPTATPRRR